MKSVLSVAGFSELCTTELCSEICTKREAMWEKLDNNLTPPDMPPAYEEPLLLENHKGTKPSHSSRLAYKADNRPCCVDLLIKKESKALLDFLPD